MKVFLSSTYLDLIDHRKAVVSALRTMDEEVGHMEVFGARDEEATTVSLEELDKCDVLVGVYAYRYGTVPTDSTTSVTEQEYIHAMSKKIPVLVFVVDESHPWPPKSMDKNLTKIKKFKSKATKEHTPDYFTSPDNLAHKVVSSIGRLAKKLSSKPPIPDSPVLISEPRKPTGSTLPSQSYFFGRDKELAIIADAISHESRTWGALIDGPGGIGKTALAIRASYLAPTSLFERKIFITAKVRELTPEGEKPLKDFSRNNYFSMLNELALELGEDGIPRLAPDERANPLRMAMAGKKTLIVFDNLETLFEDERTRLFQFLTRLPEGNKAIVTSRRRADVDARVIRLDRLFADEALQLISELAKNNHRLEREDEKARRNLYEITNGNPLLIKWVCGQLGREGSAMYTIDEACKFIDNAPEGNDPLEYIFGDLLETFTESETKVLAALTYFSQPAKLEWIADIATLPEKAAETTLEDLADRSILTANVEALEFFLPPLATQFMKTRRSEAVIQTGDVLVERAYALVLQHRKAKNFEGYKTLSGEWLSIAAALPNLLEGENKRLQAFCKAIEQFLDFSGRWDEELSFWLQAENKAVMSKDLLNAGRRVYEMSKIHYYRGQTLEMADCISRIKKYWKNINRTQLMTIEGKFFLLEKKYSTAIKTFEKVLKLEISISPDSQRVATTLNNLAGAESYAGDNVAAEGHYLEAIRLARKLNDLNGISTCTGNLAGFYLRQKEWVNAELKAKESLGLAEQIGRRGIIASNCLRIAEALINQNRSDEGISFALRAIEILTNLDRWRLARAQDILTRCRNATQN